MSIAAAIALLSFCASAAFSASWPIAYLSSAVLATAFAAASFWGTLA